jgi:O-antigen/teichoic acid export membrane protein
VSATTEPPPTPSLTRQVAGAVRWNALVPVRVALGSLASLALINTLSRDDYGVVVLIGSLAGLLGTWIDMGVERSLPKFYPEVERDGGRAGLTRFVREIALFKLVVVLVLIAAMLLGRDWFFAFWAARATDPALRQQLDDQRWWLFGALVALLALGAVFDVLMQVLVAYFKQREFNLVSMAAALLQPVLLIGAVVLNLGLLGILAALVAVPALSIGLAWRTSVGILAATPPGGGAGPRPGFYRRLAAYSLTNYGHQVAALFTSFQFAVLFVSDLGAAALFRVGYYLPSQALQILFAPLNGVPVPLFARLREAGDMARTREAYGLLSRFLLILFCPAAAGVAMLAPNLANVLWPQYGDSALIAALMAVSLFAASGLAIARTVLMVHEIYRPIIVSRLIGLLAIPLLWWLTPRYGPLGAAVAIGATNLASEMVAWPWALRRLGLVYPWGFAGKVLLAVAAMVAVVWPLAAYALPVPATLSQAERFGPALIGQLALAGLGLVVYLAALRLLGGLSAADKAAAAHLRLPGARALLRVL